MILYLSLYVLGRSFSMVCIGKCVGSLRMCRGCFGYSNGGGVRGWALCSCDLLCTCYG